MLIPIASLLTVLTFQPEPEVMEADAIQLNREGRDLGPGDPATAMILRNLALAYLQVGDFSSAEPAANLALSIFETRFGTKDIGLSPILNVLAECYASTGRLEVARRITERAIALGEDAGPHYGTALHNLGALHELSGDFEGATSFYTRAIAAKSESMGSAHPHVALSRAALRRVQRREMLSIGPRIPVRLEQAAE
jgi:tetratricopeptide (TPR) repeat protein